MALDGIQSLLADTFRKYKGKLLIKPSKSSIKSIKTKVRDYLNANKNRRTDVVIAKLNTIIRGRANYYRHVVSRKVFGLNVAVSTAFKVHVLPQLQITIILWQ